MNDLKGKAKGKINAAASTAKRATGQLLDKSREIANTAGKTLTRQGKRLQNL